MSLSSDDTDRQDACAAATMRDERSAGTAASYREWTVENVILEQKVTS